MIGTTHKPGHGTRRASWTILMILEAGWTGMFLGFLPVVRSAVERYGVQYLVPIGATYGGIFLFLQDRANRWRCPRCSKCFLRNKGSGYALPFRKRCGGCGLLRGCEDF